jgi:hypothetical protein
MDTAFLKVKTHPQNIFIAVASHKERVITLGRNLSRIRRIKGFFHLAPLLRAIIETKKGDIIVFYGFSNGL